jgi:periplasmic protein TonB
VKADHAGFLVSGIFHLIIVGLFLSVPLYRHPPVKTLAVDFTILKSRQSEKNPVELRQIRGSRIEDRGTRIEERRTGRNLETLPVVNPQRIPAVEREPSTPQSDFGSTNSEPRSPNTGSDPAGEVSVRGETGGGAGRGGPGQDRSASGQGTGGFGPVAGPGAGGTGMTLNFGRGGGDSGAFSYIRDGIMRNVVYPERARKMGWEGRVLLSFVVHENGSIHEVKVMTGSGFRALDDSAAEAARRTTFSRRTPYRLSIILPVEYRLE